MRSTPQYSEAKCSYKKNIHAKSVQHLNIVKQIAPTKNLHAKCAQRLSIVKQIAPTKKTQREKRSTPQYSEAKCVQTICLNEDQFFRSIFFVNSCFRVFHAPKFPTSDLRPPPGKKRGWSSTDTEIKRAQTEL